MIAARERTAVGSEPIQKLARKRRCWGVVPHAVEINGVLFDTVKSFHPRQGSSSFHRAQLTLIDDGTESLRAAYPADPICYDVSTTLPLELHIVNFFFRRLMKPVKVRFFLLTNPKRPSLNDI